MMNHDTGISSDLRGRWAAVLDFASTAAVCALLVLRLITATEGAVQGTTQWIAALSFLTLVVWVGSRYFDGRLGIRWGVWDIAVGLILAGHALGAGLVFWKGGDRRAALNLLWEWLGVGTTVFLLARVATRSTRGRSSILIALMAATAALAGLGIWQHHIGYSQKAQWYEVRNETWRRLSAKRHRLTVSESVELARIEGEFIANDVPLDAVGRRAFEQRLLHSTEPYGFFGLANTFAGVLAAGLVLLLGRSTGLWPVPQARTDQRPVRHGLCGIVMAVLILGTGYCLLLTKSRTAWVGLLAGGATWLILRWLSSRRTPSAAGGESRRPWLVVGSVGLSGLLVVAAFWSGGLDRFVFSEAGKSLRYRLEWWQATQSMLSQSPLSFVFGTGLGNFRQHYLPFKLPQSSEEITDPHNLFLDAWANGGLVALAGVLAVVGLVLWRMGQRFPTGERISDGRTERWLRQPALVGVGLAFAAALLNATDDPQRSAELLYAGGGALLAAIVLSVREDEGWERSATAGAFVCLAVHLLGAGGLGMPAVSQLLLGLAFLAGSGSAVGIREGWDGPFKFLIPLAVATALIAGGWKNLVTVNEAAGELAEGDYQFYQRRQAATADAAYARAARADPLSPTPWEKRGTVAFALSEAIGHAGDSAEAFERAVGHLREAMARDPDSHAWPRMLGEMYARRFGRTRRVDDAREAVRWLQVAIARYPTRASLQRELALAADKAGNQPLATAAAARALELHQINVQAGHPDKQLTDAERQEMRKLSQ